MKEVERKTHTSELEVQPLKPIMEQQRAIELFRKGGNLRIDAYAGTGKTTTLRLLSMQTSARGLYLAFNRSMASEARQRFSSHVKCATPHSIAYRNIQRAYSFPEWKLTTSITPNRVLEVFRMPSSISFHAGLVLEQRSYAAILCDGLKAFLRSSDKAPSETHVPHYGILETLPPEQFASFARQAAGHLQYLWQAMLDRDQGLPLGHDGYLKLWALSEPRANADYLMVDEAQDLNSVLIDVLRRSACPIVYVGDPYQQVYEWRGAVNAMHQVLTEHHCLLSQSFRFGPEIANAANVILRSLGAKVALQGNASRDSYIGNVKPDVILARSNAGVISNVIGCLSNNLKCAVIGGTKELELLLADVQRLKAGHPAQSSELIGFHDWSDVITFSSAPEGGNLRPLVGLVREHGETRMLRALSACETNERSAHILCSTAHRSKGREWNYVLLDKDFEAVFMRAARLPVHQARATTTSECRLLYVALTRAKLGVQLPSGIAKRFGIRATANRSMTQVGKTL